MFFPPRCDHSFAFREVPRMTATEAGTFLFVIIMLVPFIAELSRIMRVHAAQTEIYISMYQIYICVIALYMQFCFSLMSPIEVMRPCQ
jgi:hypothetical protein